MAERVKLRRYYWVLFEGELVVAEREEGVWRLPGGDVRSEGFVEVVEGPLAVPDLQAISAPKEAGSG